MLWVALCVIFGTVGVQAQSSVICSGLGSFTDAPPFNNLPLPHCPEDLGSDLHLEYFSNPNPNNPQSVIGTDRTTIPSNWSPGRDTIFVVHGWTNDIDTGWLEDFKNAHLEYYDMNVVVVGWGGPYGAGDINYQWSASTTRTIGAHIGEVMRNMVTSGGTSDNRFHLVGHSLGAHVSGHAGRWYSDEYGGRIGRITGMDPAGPEFVSVDDRTIGLWTDCASFVDSINTDNVYGSTPLSLGHQNYYPNGGVNQPGCDQADNLCSHGRVTYLYQESLDQSCMFASRERCSDSSNLPGSCQPCTGVCGAMGYPAADGNYADGVYYLTTRGNSPYCQG